MTIVFDEVTGSVEPRAAARPEDSPREDAQGGAQASPQDEVRLDRWLRRRAWLERRRRAD